MNFLVILYSSSPDEECKHTALFMDDLMTLPSPTTSTSATTDKALSILKFWHSVEFFVPFDLEDVIARALTSTIGQEELLEHGNDTIPWLSTYAKKKIGCEATKTYNYHLYLLPFNKNELTRLSRYYFPQKFSAIKTIEFEERLADEGTTCFAKLPIDSYGRPDFTKLSVSTLPWAMGCIIREELSFLSAHYYAKEQSKLQIALQELAMHIDLTESPLLSDTVAAGILTAQGLTALSTILKKWAGFSPDYPAEWIIVAYEGYQNFRPEEITDENIKRIASNLPAIPIEKIAKVEVNASTEDSAKESTNSDRFDILNSFFIDDLEKVYNYLLNKPQAAILSYINGIAPEQKYDLYTEAYMPYIRDKLQVDYLTVGSWPRSPNQSLSLMQQLAIHEVFHPTNSENLFSVNGPPGTGKTTLLKDIIADIVTQRARILAGFKEVKDTFVRKHSLSFHNNTEVTIRQLAPTLTGYEILVASSNNAAVENISKELPLRKELSKEYQHACHYFAPVAAKLAAYHAKQQVYSLQDKELPWGLISIALGNARNRNLFVDRVFCSPEPKDETTSRIQKGDYLTIWEWSKKYQGPSFNDAKKAFNVANSTLTVFFREIKTIRTSASRFNQYCLA